MLRWMEMVIPTPWMEKALSMLEGEQVTLVYHGALDDRLSVIRAILPAEGGEALLDRLEKAFAFGDGFRLVLMPVSACIPRVDYSGEPQGGGQAGDGVERLERADSEGVEEAQRRRVDRIYREELYEQIADMASGSRYYLAMVLLSSIVAGIGIIRGNLAVIIGAMVIAPLLGPNVALAFSVTLADEVLGWKAIKTLLMGIIPALLIAWLWGALMPVDPAWPEVAARTSVSLSDLVLALAAGGAGVLSITAGVPTTLVGVMVAVALLPPLVTCGLLLGSSAFKPAGGAALVFAVNVICINLAGVVAFVFEGIRPNSWLEAHRARRSTVLAVLLWLILLTLLLAMILEPSGNWRHVLRELFTAGN